MQLKPNTKAFFSGTNYDEETPNVEGIAGTDSTTHIVQIETELLIPFDGHTFDCTEDDLSPDFLESISRYGIIIPIKVLPKYDGEHEIIAGHRRQLAAKLLGMETVPCIIMDTDRDTAVIYMTDSNKQREQIKPSEKARSLLAKYEALKNIINSEIENEEYSTKNGDAMGRLLTEENLTEGVARRWLSCGKLPVSLLDFMNNKAFNNTVGAVLSSLSSQSLDYLVEYLEQHPKTVISKKQAEQLKKLCDQFANLEYSQIEELFSVNQEKKTASLSLKGDILNSIFDDHELTDCDDNTLLDFIRQAVTAYKEAGNSLVSREEG